MKHLQIITLINSIIILLFLTCALEVMSQSKTEQLIQIKKYKNLKVKNVSLFEYNYTIEGERNKDGFLREQIDYDQEGRKTESRRYDGEKLYQKFKYNYDENNIEVRYYWENDDGDKFKVVHQYDNRGFLIKSEEYNKSSLIKMTIEYFYNSKGKLEKEVHNYAEHLIFEYKYDLNGNLIEKISSPWDGRNKEKTIFSYDENNLVIDAITFDILGDPILEIVYKYQFYQN